MNMVLALLFKQSNKANFYNMRLALESFFTNALLCKVQQLPKKKENNQYKPNTHKTTLFKKKILSSRTKQIRFPIVVSPDIEVNLIIVDKVCNCQDPSKWITKKGIIKKKNMTPQLRPVTETLQRRLDASRPQHTPSHNEEIFFEVGDCVLLKDKTTGQSQLFSFHINILSALSVLNLGVFKKNIYKHICICKYIHIRQTNMLNVPIIGLELLDSIANGGDGRFGG
ncbi:hypothetical protein RFI_36820 [Reticulomyxa filosa]|uniref:Uncharacterized protein n=1 Tax=Reticulomyxa filosa TaxID=46433 RepID=X6LIT6_RETFI|nr:hypothetical protein RFI_36820 [Reticulomyxa filosa]|eukprot:ETO00620.1 hypothetical protein RFI_36820 [Reticulomyxa filosa]